MQKHPEYTRTRLKQLTDRVFQKIYAETLPIADLRISPKTNRITHDAAQKLSYSPAKMGLQLGPLWATYWFKAKARVPKKWAGRRVDLLWVSHSEATLWRDGRTCQGLNHEPSSWDRSTRRDAVLLEQANGGETLQFEIEAACNRVFGSGESGNYKTISPFILEQCDLALFDEQVWELYYDLKVLVDLEAEQAKSDSGLDPTWGGELLSELNRFANTFNLEDRSTWPAAHGILKQLYTRRNAACAHELSAVGHAHIDTAWLWPLAETWRKCERTFSSQVAYMDAYPEHKFACSQAVQYAMMKKKNPELYERIKAKVEAGQFVPVGGTWVEPDCNIPSGEALSRQFLQGQRFFQKEFGITCREFWNPDVFGYNGQLPQLMRLAGITRFLTQKLSWNRFNKPPHHTFMWEGIDGSQVLAHFPPTDTYNAVCDVAQLRQGTKSYKDNDRSRHSYLLFGYGDGGGGPTKQMLEMLRRARDLQGLPRTQIRSSSEFFELLEQDCTDRPLVIGELYFEYHRGTYTTQALTKRNNRKNEILLHDVEFISAIADKLGKAKYPARELERMWQTLLTNQFHDILPGSSITLVYKDAKRDHEQIRRSGQALCQRALKALAGKGKGFTPVNTTGFARKEVAAQPNGELAFVEAASYGVGAIRKAPESLKLKTLPSGDMLLENGQLRVELARSGRVLNMFDKKTRREALAGPANVFELYEDEPTNFDAWDVDPFHIETRNECAPATACRVLSSGPLRVSVEFEYAIGTKSSIKQEVRLDAGARRLEFHNSVEWKERHRMLKVAFPVQVRAMDATYEMQFGCVQRPTHFNTSFDLAMYEVPGHKWVDLSEHGFGVALLSDCKYGYSTFGNTMRMSLLRGTTSPDPVADLGSHQFAYALYPHAGGWQQGGVVAEAYRFNVPIQWAPGVAEPRSFASVNDANLVLDTIKKAEDSRDLVLRLYEAHGARGTAKVKVNLPFTAAAFCNILEEEQAQAVVENGEVVVPYQPYQVITIKLQ
ncbi:MAG TPA: alpha-mannosidase [Planctomycetota bacterium]|jgi:alpha-mannosidase